MQGTIERLNSKSGFGFIRIGDDREWHIFDKYDLRGLAFDARLVGQAVEFESERGDRGLKARKVRRLPQ